MSNEDIKTQVEEILGSSSDWCSCQEGDFDNIFPEKQRLATNQILSLINEARIEILDDLSKFLDDHQKAPNGGWIDYHYVKNYLRKLEQGVK